jgi:predicted cation transporter
MLITILGILFICILFLPLSVKKVERNIEVFLLVMAVIAVTASHYLGAEACWTRSLVESSLVEPVKLTVATLIFGIIFRMLREPLKRKIVTWESRLGPRIFVALIIFSLGILSSLITAIIAALSSARSSAHSVWTGNMKRSSPCLPAFRSVWELRLRP